MNPQLRPLNSNANLDIFWPHFVCNSSACTSWLWIGIRYLSNWNKFKHLMWNIKFYKYSYSHSISTDYLFRGRNKDIFFSGKHKETKAKLNWIICQWIIRVCFREGPKVHFSQLSEADQAFCLQTQKPYGPRTMDTQWSHKSKMSEKLGRCGRQIMLRPYLKIWDWDWIFCRAVNAFSSLSVHSPCYELLNSVNCTVWLLQLLVMLWYFWI